jgi:hypothetical protein
MGSLSLRIFPFPGFRDCGLPFDGVRFAACSVNPVSPRIFAGGLLAACRYGKQAPCPGGPAGGAVIYFVSPAQYRFAV